MQGTEHQVTRQGGLGRDGGGFPVTNFSHQNHIRILAEHASQQTLKREPDAVVDLMLGDRREANLHGVFQGGDIDVGLVDLSQTGIQRGGFAATGRATAENNPIGSGDAPLYRVADGVGESDRR